MDDRAFRRGAAAALLRAVRRAAGRRARRRSARVSRRRRPHAAAFYGADLAYVHDVGFTDFARRAAPALLRLLRAHRVRGRVVDLGCGSGVWARALTDAGYEVLGIDVSAAMLRRARRNAPRARWRRASLFRAALPPCGAVTAIGECVSYAFDRAAGPSALERLFRRVHAALAPGGVFVFDVLEPGQLAPGAVRHVHREGDDWATLVDATEDPRRRVLTRRITSFRRVGARWRRGREIHRVRLYERTTLRRALARTGFAVRELRAYGRRCTFAPRHVAFVARKR
jgi:SAM-dependent methyltransferase